MFKTEHEPLALLVELTPRLAKRRFREEIYKDWEHKCAYCGDAATSLDHVIPKFQLLVISVLRCSGWHGPNALYQTLILHLDLQKFVPPT